MECEAASEAEDKMRPPKSGEGDSTVLQTTIEQYPSNDVATVAKVASNPVSEKPFPFLQLPPETRDAVYQNSCIYEIDGSEMISGLLTFPDLRQAPITRVNKQIRNETLPIFYGNHNFSIMVPSRAEPWKNSNNGRDNFKHVWEMLRSFATAPAPGAKSNMQTSSLRFLTRLAFRVGPDLASHDAFAFLGFTMSSKKLTCEKGNRTLETENLDWERFSKVKKAYYDSICKGIDSRDEGLKHVFVGVLNSRTADSRIDELVSLMCFLALHCPHLKSNVVISVEGYVDDISDMSD